MPDSSILGEGQLAAAARAAGQAAPSREARRAARLPRRRAGVHQGVRPVRDELGDRRAGDVAARRHGRWESRASARARAAFPRPSPTARPGCSCRRAIPLRSLRHRAAAEGRTAAPAHGRSRPRARARSSSASRRWSRGRSPHTAHPATELTRLGDTRMTIFATETRRARRIYWAVTVSPLRVAWAQPAARRRRACARLT